MWMTMPTAASIDELFRIAVDRKASDLHLVAGMAPILRIDGLLQAIAGKPKLSGADIRTLLKPVLSDKQWNLLETEREMDLSY